MKLNRNGKLAKFYMWLPPDDKKLPQDFCTYFWGLVGRAFFIFGMSIFLLAMLVFAIVKGAIFLWANKFITLFALCLFLFMALVILSRYYDKPDGYHIGAEHDQVYMYETDKPLSVEDIKRMIELGWFQEYDERDGSEDFTPADYRPDESWTAFV